MISIPELKHFVIILKADEFISEMHGNDLLLDENMHAIHCLHKCNIPLTRNTADLTTTTYGQQLTDFCRDNDLFILNGRFGKDAVAPKRHVRAAAP